MYGQNHPERIKLNNQIREWNTNRLDLFEISEPNEYLEFYGVMRFFYQGDDLKYQTKCLRVSSTATTLDLIEAVVIKFHPDLKMLSNDRYALYESHNMQDRKMRENEHPLIVQLNWANDDKDGKFILKNESRRRRSTDLTSHAMLNNYSMSKSTSALGNIYDSQTLRSQSSTVYSSSTSNFFTKRMLSSKKSKRRGKVGRDSIQDSEEALRLAAELSGKPPESSFTRTISNPDEVMKRRRQRKLESRLEHFSGANETGGTLKIYGDSINPDIPYKTLLLSVNDTAEKVLSETLDKYGLAQEDHRFYVLVQQNIPSKDDRNRHEMPQEIILHDQDCPLGILVHRPPKRGNATFAVRRRTPMDKFPSKPRMPPFSVSRDSLAKSPGSKQNDNRDAQLSSQSLLPATPTIAAECPRLVKLMIDHEGNLFDEADMFSLVSLINNDSKDASPNEGSRFIKIGSQPSAVGNYPNILLPQENFPDIRPTHCHISAKIDSQTGEIRLTLTPTLDSVSRVPKPCLVYINQQKIEKSTKLEHEDIIQVGESVLFKFESHENQYLNLSKESSHFVSNHNGEDNSDESFKMQYWTADLPVTIKYSYNLCQQLIDKIMNLSRMYAEKGTQDLFGCNVHLKYNNLDELFRLAPAYMFYLVLRSGLGKDKHFSNLIDIIAHQIEQVIQDDKNSVEKEVFWLSNTSELLHLLQCDNDLRFYSASAQEVLASAIEQAFSILQTQFSQDLMILLPAFIDEDDSDTRDDIKEDISPCLDRASVLITYGDIDYPIQHLLQTLSLAYNLFHNCQVNVALTIQMFSQLFHLLNTWLFNAVLGDRSNIGDDTAEPLPVCPEWGQRLNRRLTRIRNWSETNGLDMAANCHLQKMYQVVELMEANKSDLNLFGEKCLELININGTQLHALLENCVSSSAIPNAWIEVVVNTAIQLHDQTFNDGVPQNKNSLPLYEDLDLRLPLLLPADGYCCDRGIVSCPKDLKSMLNSLTGILSYQLNPPTIEEIDTRWKSYLGPYENTPSVSRSGTIVEQSPSAQIKINTQLGFPRNVITDERSSMALSSSPDSEGESDIYPKNKQLQESRIPNRRNKVPVDLSFEDYKATSKEFSGESSDDQIYKGDLKNRYIIKLKKINNSLGLSIIAARRSPNEIFRIYVKDVIIGGAANKSGRIEIGDQLVSVDGQLLEDISQDEAVEFMKKTKPTVKLLMERDAASRHGVLDVILKSKSAKALPTQLNQKKPPVLANELVKAPKQKQNLLINKTPIGKPMDNTESARYASREHMAIKKPTSIGKEKTKRPDYKIPPVPQYGKAPPRPARAPPEQRYKPKVEDMSDPDYHSLPVRQHRSAQLPLPKLPKYATNNKGRRGTEDLSYNSLQNVKSNPKKFSSQPNLVSSVPRKRLDSPVLSSETESSGSISTSDEEDSVENKPPVIKSGANNRQNASIYAKIPIQHKQNPASNVSPVKALSDNNIRLSSKGIPRNEITASADPINHRSPKNQFLNRPVIATNSDPITKNNSGSSGEHLNLQSPVRFSNNKKNRSHSISSESESETLSSVSQSLSSDPSPKPQGKINSEPIISTRPSKKLDNLEDKTSVTTPKSPLKQNYSRPDELPFRYAPMTRSEETQLTQPKVLNTTKPVDMDYDKSIKPHSTISNVQIYPAPFPTALHPQYHPPNTLEENNWNTELRNPIVKTPTDEEIRMRRKAIEDKIRHETDIYDKKDDSVSSPTSEYQALNSSISNDTKPNRNSARYGRPQFNDNKNRPQSELNIPINNGKSNYPDPIPPPSIIQKGIIVPALPTDTSHTVGTNEIYPDHMQKSNSRDNHQFEPTEQLSFKEKIKLFAQKNGEGEVVNRNRFSSKQRRIESGDFS